MTVTDLRTYRHLAPNGDGWQLALKQVYAPARLRPELPPLVIVPGYGMNAFIFGFHPRGDSMEAYLAKAGHEVWSVNLRAQGDSVGERRNARFGLHDLAVTDLRAALDYIRTHATSRHETVDVVGCSLGGTILFAYAGLLGPEHVRAMVALGSPLRWEKIHPALKVAFGSPWVAGKLKIKGSRRFAAAALPYALRIPGFLDLYMHPELIDISRLGDLVKTVEDPHPDLNREIAVWLKTRDLILNGVNISKAMRDVRNPLLIMLANADGIVPPETALSVRDHIGSTRHDTITVGDDKLRFAHADLFVSNYSQDLVFRPIAEWLQRL